MTRYFVITGTTVVLLLTALVGTIDIARAATAPATHHAMATGV